MNRLILFLLLLPAIAVSQEVQHLNLPQVQEWAAAYFPLLKQKALARQATLANNSNVDNNYLPQINVGGQATWQNAVTEVPVRIPGFAPEPLSKDQYRIMLDLNQLIYDGGQTKQQKNLNVVHGLLKEEEVNIGLQQLKERMNGYYFGVLLLDEQRKLVALVIADLEAGIKKVEAQVQNGTAYRSNLAMLQSEKLKARQRDQELLSERQGLIQVLKIFTNQPISDNVTLQVPEVPANTTMQDITRPELSYYHLWDSLSNIQKKQIDGRLRPRVSVFANGGYGRPGLDMLKNEFAPYVTTGIRVNWNIGSFYNSKKERELIDLSKRDMLTQQENFLIQVKAQLTNQKTQIEKIKALLETDEEILQLKKLVKDAAFAQLENGVINANDYLREVNAEDEARQNKILHQLQLLKAQIDYSTISGK